MSDKAKTQMAKWAAPYIGGRAIIRRAELQRRVPFSMVHIWRLEQRDEFPRRIQLGANSVGWYADEIDAWCEARIRAGGRAPTGKRRATGTAPEAA